ncbi:MAG TPA: lipocalin family protein [Spirochaetota bacterium]|nr:lipocalin family protein [Spirochaetota bacterium]
MKKIIIFLLSVIITGCSSVSVPEGVDTVKDFDLSRYLGKWYEIARLDHSFERGLIKVSAEYSLRDDGGVKVINRGFNTLKNKWNDIEGKAYFTGDTKTGELKVSFFGPFYGSYNIMELDKTGYTYSLVCGPDKSYLWILARTPDPDKKIIDRLVQKAASLGFDTSTLIYVTQKD